MFHLGRTLVLAWVLFMGAADAAEASRFRRLDVGSFQSDTLHHLASRARDLQFDSPSNDGMYELAADGFEVTEKTSGQTELMMLRQLVHFQSYFSLSDEAVIRVHRLNVPDDFAVDDAFYGQFEDEIDLQYDKRLRDFSAHLRWILGRSPYTRFYQIEVKDEGFLLNGWMLYYPRFQEVLFSSSVWKSED